MILNHFRGTPRDQQRHALSELESSFNSHDVFVIDGPVAVGKSLIASCAADWLQTKTTILTPTNILVDQYQDDFKDYAYLRKKFMYPCDFDHKQCHKKLKACVDCAHKKARAAVHTAPTSVMNYYMYMSMRKHFRYMTKNIICDEAHNLIPMLTDLASIKLWKKKYKYPNNLRTEEDILKWLYDSGHATKKQLKPVIASMLSDKPDYRFERTTEMYYGHEEELLKIRPLSVRNYNPVMWPKYVSKIVLMSATISHKDIEELGLSTRRVKYIKTGSPIPPSNRPVVYYPLGSFSYRNLDDTIPKLAEFLTTLLNKYKSKGIVHITYSMRNRLYPLLRDTGGRLIWHDRDNTREKYREFRQRKDNCVLIACGLQEGVDIANDYGRWQVITKVPYPSLADAAINIKAHEDPEWYQWDTIKMILQASGRICRHPQDFGSTIILDSNFEYLYKSNQHLFPEWFKQALIVR